ncbi:regulator of (H+)-ATPase in vacuolar membrane [Dissophora globulifera]|uniref:cyclic pyranopterin monophosphate synthase n=1 Tax=Dissophora globulifera TaxID=979702 RepID=A0A9P6RYW7_9FUNG|nr:regulator of (H+)-ATPase in vacuolar membrane [Dissophora globulifera]
MLLQQLYAATDSVVICDASFKPIQILFLQIDSKESQNQIVSAIVMSEFDGKIAVTTDHHVLVYAPTAPMQEGQKIEEWKLHATLPCEGVASLAWRNDGVLMTGGDYLTLWAQKDGEWTQQWQQRSSDAPVDVLFTMARDGICRIWSPLILLQPASMSICAIIDPNQWLVSQQQSTVQYPIHALDGMEFAMAVEYAASKTVDKLNDANSIRLRKLKELVRDTSDLFFQIQGDGSMIIWGVQNLGEIPQRLPRVMIVLRISQAVSPLEASFFMRNIIAYHDTALARSRGNPADVVIVGQSHEGRVSCFSVNMMELFDSGNSLAGLSLRQSWTGQQSRIKAIVKDHRQLCFTSFGDLGDISLWKLKTPRFGHRVAAGLVEIGSLPIGARNVQLVTPAWEGGSFMVYDGNRITLYNANESAECSETLDLPDYDPDYPLILLDSFEIPFLVQIDGPAGKTTDVSWKRYILGFSAKDNTVFTWMRSEGGLPVLFSKEHLPPSSITHAVTVESFAGTLPKSLHSTHVNVFATYSKDQANISYWQCGNDLHAHKGGQLWRKAEHLPTKDNLKRFECGANGKLAMVYENSDGTCDLEIWGSVGGRATGRLEAQFARLEPIYDLDWMVTADARHNLAVAFKSTVSMYSQQRTEEVTSPPIWKRFLDINIPSFINHPISSIAWLDMGTLSVGAGGTMLLYSKWLSEDYMTFAPGFEDLSSSPTLQQALATMHGPFVDYHPSLLIEFFLWGKFEVVRKILFSLYHYMSYVNETGDASTGPLPIPLEVILKTDEASKVMRADHNDLFMSEDDFKSSDESRFLNDRTSEEMIEFLTRIPLAGLSKGAQFQLSAFIEGFARIDKQHGSIDDSGLRFLMAVRRFNYLSYILPPHQRPTMLSYRDVTWAYHSESQLKQLEVIARNQYNSKDEKDPVGSSLFYLALKKKKLLHGLWRTTHGHAEQAKMVAFLSNDFDQDRWKTAALKNAFALLGKQRFEYAAAFFLLANKLQDAVNVCVKNLNDFQLAITLCRIFEQEECGPVLTQLLQDLIETTKDPWLLSHFHSMLGQTFKALRVTLCGDSETVSSKSDEFHSHRDPSLLILYRHLRKITPNASSYEGDEEFSAVVRAAEAYEHYGCPLLSLVILKHWGYVMPVDSSSKRTTEVRNLLQVRRDSILSLPKSTSTSSFMGGFKLPTEASSNIGSGILNFDDFGTTKKTGSSQSNVSGGEEASLPTGMSLMGGFRSKEAPPSEQGSMAFDFDSFGNGSKKAIGNSGGSGGMSLMGGFRSVNPSAEVNSGVLDFDSFGAAPKKQNGQSLDTPKAPSMSLMGGFRSTSSDTSKIDSGTLDFDSFGSMGQAPSSKTSQPAKPKDIFADFAPPADDGLHTNEVNNTGGQSSSSDTVRGTEELLNDYITTLVVQLLTPMSSALRTVSLKPELLTTTVFKGYVENVKYGWDKLSEHANVSSVVMEQALISKCIEIDTLPVCFHWLNTTMSTGSPISAIVAHYSESCYSMVGIVLTERLTSCMKAHIKEYARGVLESSSEWFSLAKTVIKAELALPRWEQMVLASYIMLVIMSLQEQDYAVLAGMLFQWRRFSGFVVGDRGGAVKVIAEVLGGKLYSPLDASAISMELDRERSERETVQSALLNAATTNALVMSLEGLLREHGHRMSDETRKFITSSFMDRLTRSGIEQEKKVIELMKKSSPLQDHLRGYLNGWQKKYWVLLSGLESSGGHLLPLVGSFLESQRQGRESPPTPVEDTTPLFKARSVITSFSFNPVERRIAAVCSRTDIIEIDLSKVQDFSRSLHGPDAYQSDMDSEMDLDEEDVDDGDFLDAQGNIIDHSASTSRAPSIIATESSEETASRTGSEVNLQNVLKNFFSKGNNSRHSGQPYDPLQLQHGGLAHAVTDANLRRSQGLPPAAGHHGAISAVTSAAGAKSTEVDNIVVRTDILATCSESHPSFPLYLTGHNPALDYPCVSLWQFGQSKELNHYTGTSAKVTRVRFDSFGQKFGATDAKGDMHLWRFDSNVVGSKPFLTLNAHDKIARDFAFLGSSSVVATTGTSGDGRNVALWDTLLPKDKAQTHSFKVHDRGGYSLAFSRRHQLLVSGGRDGEICIFDIRQSKLLHTIHAHDMHVRSLFIDQASSTLCSGSGEGDMKVWNLDTFEQLSSFGNLQARNRFQIQTFDRIPVKAYGVAQIAATEDWYYTCGPTGFLRTKRKFVRMRPAAAPRAGSQNCVVSLMQERSNAALTALSSPAIWSRTTPPRTAYHFHTTRPAPISSSSPPFSGTSDSSGAKEEKEAPQLTHTDPKTGKASMVSVTDKPSTHRTALAVSSIWLPGIAFDLLKRNAHKKGDVLTVAQIAGIQAAKQTSNLIPLCHPLLLTHVSVDLKLVQDPEQDQDQDHELRGGKVEIESRVACMGNTGVEMEALTGATIAALTVFDMCKAVGKNMVIGEIKVMEKTGGKSGVYRHQQKASVRG